MTNEVLAHTIHSYLEYLIRDYDERPGDYVRFAHHGLEIAPFEVVQETLVAPKPQPMMMTWGIAFLSKVTCCSVRAGRSCESGLAARLSPTLYSDLRICLLAVPRPPLMSAAHRNLDVPQSRRTESHTFGSKSLGQIVRIILHA